MSFSSRKLSVILSIILITLVIYQVLEKSSEIKSTLINNVSYNNQPTTLKVINNRVVLSSEGFVENYLSLFHNFNEYQGIEIEMEGFVYRQDRSLNNKFTVARKIITCTGDHDHPEEEEDDDNLEEVRLVHGEEEIEIVGFLSYWETSEEILDNTWVRIVGNLQSIQYYDEVSGRNVTTPIIVVDTLELIPKPKDTYIHR